MNQKLENDMDEQNQVENLDNKNSDINTYKNK